MLGFMATHPTKTAEKADPKTPARNEKSIADFHLPENEWKLMFSLLGIAAGALSTYPPTPQNQSLAYECSRLMNTVGGRIGIERVRAVAANA